MPRLLARVLPIALAFVMLPLLTDSADASYWYRDHCVGSTGPLCYFWKGTVTHVSDGDTINVDIAGDNTSTPEPIRFTGINAMEMHRYSNDPANWTGECQAVAAAKLVYDTINGKTVRLAAQNAGSKSGSRLRRQIS